jgi:hypothetical protein
MLEGHSGALLERPAGETSERLRLAGAWREGVMCELCPRAGGGAGMRTVDDVTRVAEGGSGRGSGWREHLSR